MVGRLGAERVEGREGAPDVRALGWDGEGEGAARAPADGLLRVAGALGTGVLRGEAARPGVDVRPEGVDRVTGALLP